MTELHGKARIATGIIIDQGNASPVIAVDNLQRQEFGAPTLVVKRLTQLVGCPLTSLPAGETQLHDAASITT